MPAFVFLGAAGGAEHASPALDDNGDILTLRFHYRAAGWTFYPIQFSLVPHQA
eukprot:SAG11_NODE_293_length_11144_cov_4.661928_12_plen_53_part_00